MRQKVKHPQQHFWILQRRRLLQENQPIHHRKIRGSKPRPPALHLPVQCRPRFRNLLQQLHHGALHRARMPEINPHPVGSRKLAGFRRSNSLCRRLVLRLPAQRVVVAPMPEVQKASRRHQKIQRRLQLLSHRSPQRTRIRPVMQLVHRRNQRQPGRHVAVAQPARSLLQIRLQVIQRHPIFPMPLARDLRQPLQQGLGFPHHQLRNRFVMQPPEQDRGRPRDSGSREGKW